MAVGRRLSGALGRLAAAIETATNPARHRQFQEVTAHGTPSLPGRDLVERIRRSKINYKEHQNWRAQRKSELIAAGKELNLKAVQRIAVRFDPFHERSTSARELLWFVSLKRVRATNPECVLRTDVVDTGEDPTITVDLENGQKILFVTTLLETLDVVREFKRITDRLYTPPDEISAFKLKGY